MALDKEVQNELHKAAGRVIKLLRKDLKPVYADMGAIKGEITDINESVARIKKDLIEIEQHLQSVRRRRP